MADKRKVPIDIQYKQLLGALVDRRIVPQKWLEQHKQLREAVAVLYPALPPASDALDKLRANKPSHEDVNYFDCKLVLELLAASDEGQGKNFFGQYTSSVLKQWSALVRQYEKSNVFAAEAARVIAQNTAFEMCVLYRDGYGCLEKVGKRGLTFMTHCTVTHSPFLKKSMQQNEKQVADNNRKILDLNKSIIEYKRKLEAACVAMGIPGNNFRSELQRLPLELPAIYQAAADTLCSEKIANAIAYHETIQAYLHNCEVPAVESGSGEPKSKKTGDGEESFELVSAPFQFFTALKELKEADASLEEAPLPTSLDFEAEAAEISWDITLDDSGAAGGGDTIDWGIETVATQEGEGTEQAPAEIDWDITTSDMSAEIVTVEEETPAAEPKPSTRVGLLSDSDFRTRVLNDLQELRAFLRQREVELLDESHQVQDSLHKLEQQSVEAVRGFQSTVAGAIAELTDKRLQQLVLIQTSDRYLDRQVTSLEMLTKQMDKSRREIGALEDKNADLIDATSRLQPQIDALVATTKKVKRELEAALPPLFKGYKVNIIGEVNSL